MATITILLADDHAVVRSGVKAYLETQSDLQVVGECSSGEEAVRIAGELVPEAAEECPELLSTRSPKCRGLWRER